LRGLKRYLRKDGIIIVSTPSRPTKWISGIGSKLGLFSNETQEHKELFNKEQLINITKEAGYKVVYFSTFEFGFNYLFVLTPEIQK
jgi:2-polyprenyl-3-methyl-5-hydroxy-6-metoxy-1,4-benzoquinol methylase